MEGTDKKQPVRVWIDMCADIYHWGHANALRQAKEMGDILIVGIHSDEEIIKNKGPPVMNEQERLAVVESCKWVDEVTLDAPYTTTLTTLARHNVDFAVHGEDISTNADGTDSYTEVKNAGKFKLIKRTQGVSTTDLVGRMLLMTKDHFVTPKQTKTNLDTSELPTPQQPTPSQTVPYAPVSSRTFFQFLGTSPPPKETDRIAYIDGAFDLFHAGHVSALRQARELCDYLIVGIHSDQDLNNIRGYNMPIMNLHERALCVLSCRYVDEVIIGSPMNIIKEYIEQLRISFVVHGDERDEYHPMEPDPYAYPKEIGIYREIKSTKGLSTTVIIERIIENRAKYTERNRKRAEKDLALKAATSSSS